MEEIFGIFNGPNACVLTRALVVVVRLLFFFYVVKRDFGGSPCDSFELITSIGVTYPSLGTLLCPFVSLRPNFPLWAIFAGSFFKYFERLDSVFSLKGYC